MKTERIYAAKKKKKMRQRDIGDGIDIFASNTGTHVFECCACVEHQTLD